MLVLHFFLGLVAGPILQDPSREQLQLNCIMKLVTALEGMKEIVEEQDVSIASIQDELSALKSQLEQSNRVVDNDATPLEELTSKTENDLLTLISDQLSEQQTLSGMSLEDLRHCPMNAYHSGAKQQNGSCRPQSYSEAPSNDLMPSWPLSLAEDET